MTAETAREGLSEEGTVHLRAERREPSLRGGRGFQQEQEALQGSEKQEGLFS